MTSQAAVICTCRHCWFNDSFLVVY